MGECVGKEHCSGSCTNACFWGFCVCALSCVGMRASATHRSQAHSECIDEFTCTHDTVAASIIGCTVGEVFVERVPISDTFWCLHFLPCLQFAEGRGEGGKGGRDTRVMHTTMLQLQFLVTVFDYKVLEERDAISDAFWYYCICSLRSWRAVVI